MATHPQEPFPSASVNSTAISASAVRMRFRLTIRSLQLGISVAYHEHSDTRHSPQRIVPQPTRFNDRATSPPLNSIHHVHHQQKRTRSSHHRPTASKSGTSTAAPKTAAWLACASAAYSSRPPQAQTGTAQPCGRIQTGTSDTNRTRRTQLTALAAVTVNRSGQPTLRFPARWPWAHQFHQTLSALRALPGPSG